MPALNWLLFTIIVMMTLVTRYFVAAGTTIIVVDSGVLWELALGHSSQISLMLRATLGGSCCVEVTQVAVVAFSAARCPVHHQSSSQHTVNVFASAIFDLLTWIHHNLVITDQDCLARGIRWR